MGTDPTAAHDWSRWLEAAGQALKGAPFESLRSVTREGAIIQPLYGPGTAPAGTRAWTRAAGRGGWDIRAEIGGGDAAAANRQVLEALAGGCTSLLLRVGPGGLASAEDLARALDGVVLEAAPAALDAGLFGPLAGEWLADAARGSPSAQLALNLDPLGAFAVAGESPGPIDAHVRRAAATAAKVAKDHPKASLFLASGRVAHEAGAAATLELAIMASATVAYVKALVEAGLSTEEAFGRIVLGVVSDADWLISICKVRAAREIWARLTAACGVDAAARIEARSSRRMLTAIDPWTNLLRLTVAGFAAAAGGADALVLGAFTDALGAPAGLARRLARDMQLILMEESGLARVEDPAAGAFALEELTDQLARRSWNIFQVFEAQGGLAAALSSDAVAAAIEQARNERQADLAEDRAPVLGVTRFPDPAPVKVEVEAAAPQAAALPEIRLPGPDSRCPPLSPMRLSQTAELIAEDLEP